MNFMQAHHDGQPVPPPSNIETFVRYARDLVELAHVDAVLITCSTMNRAYPQVQAALADRNVPVMQIDRPMMERAVGHGGRILVIATHGPTVENTQALLREVAAERGCEVSFSGLTVEAAWEHLAEGDVEGHNRILAEAIRHGSGTRNHRQRGAGAAFDDGVSALLPRPCGGVWHPGIHQRAVWI